MIHADHNFSFEGHPNNTTEAHLQTLYNWGFRRVSYGVQDNDPVVQKAINRMQPLENVKRASDIFRKVGFQSVNYDLIYKLTAFSNFGKYSKNHHRLYCLAPRPVCFLQLRPRAMDQQRPATVHESYSTIRHTLKWHYIRKGLNYFNKINISRLAWIIL